MEYDASHKASSVTSISSSSSSWDPLPSLYTGRADSVSSAYELDDLQEPEPFECTCVYFIKYIYIYILILFIIII